MKQTRSVKFSKQVICGLLSLVLLFSLYPNIASANNITPRKVILGNSIASASTTYSFVFTVPQATVIKSVGFAACTTPSGACTPAAGFSSSSSTLTSQPSGLGDVSGWSVNTATTNELRLSNASNATTPSGSQSVGFSSVVNPNYANQTFFVRITTYSAANWSTLIDTGTVASSTAGQVTVSVAIDEALTLSLVQSTVSLTTPTVASTGTGTSSMVVSTNAATGYSLSYSGTTLTSGANTLTAMSSVGGSVINSRQFGINLMANTTPTVGIAKSGTGTGAPSTGYNTADQFKFNPAGDVIASASLPTNTNTLTTSYIANMDGSTAAGVYSTVITYTVTANF